MGRRRPVSGAAATCDTGLRWRPTNDDLEGDSCMAQTPSSPQHPEGPPAHLHAARGVAGPGRSDRCRQRFSELPCGQARRLVVPYAWDARQPRHPPGPTRRRPRSRDPPTRRGDRGVPQQSARCRGGGGLRHPRPGRQQAPGRESGHRADSATRRCSKCARRVATWPGSLATPLSNLAGTLWSRALARAPGRA